MWYKLFEWLQWTIIHKYSFISAFAGSCFHTWTLEQSSHRQQPTPVSAEFQVRCSFPSPLLRLREEIFGQVHLKLYNPGFLSATMYRILLQRSYSGAKIVSKVQAAADTPEIRGFPWKFVICFHRSARKKKLCNQKRFRDIGGKKTTHTWLTASIGFYF